MEINYLRKKMKKKKKYDFYKLINSVANKTWKSTIYSDDGAQGLFQIIRTYMDENPDKTDEEVNEYLEKYIADLRSEIYTIKILTAGVVKNSITNYFINDERIRRRAYDQVIEEEKENGKIGDYKNFLFDGDEKRTELYTMREYVSTLREIESDYSSLGLNKKYLEDIIKARKKNRAAYNEAFRGESKDFIDMVCEMYGKEEFDKLKIYMTTCNSRFEKQLFEDYFSNLETIGNRLDSFGMLDKNNKSYLSFLEGFRLEEMEYRTKDDKPLKEAIFGRDTLKKYSLPELSAISAFWVNRYAKELENVSNTYLAIRELNLIPEIRNAGVSPKTGFIKVKTDKDKLAILNEKNLFLTKVLRIAIEDAFQDSVATNSAVIGNDGNTVELYLDEKYKEIIDDIGDEYTKYFSNKDPEGKHNLLADIENNHSTLEAIINMYNKKDMDMLALLYNLNNYNISSNWGLIVEEGKDIIRQPMVIIGVDLNEVNMPIRLHMVKNDLLNLLNKRQGNCIMRLYEGDKDFNIGGRIYSTPILSPSGKKQGNFLKSRKETETNEDKKNLIEHLLFLNNRRQFPEHLMLEREDDRKITQVVKVKGKNRKKEITQRVKIKYRPNVRYIDLRTRKLYERDLQGVYTEIPEIKNQDDDDDSR